MRNTEVLAAVKEIRAQLRRVPVIERTAQWQIADRKIKNAKLLASRSLHCAQAGVYIAEARYCMQFVNLSH